MAEPRIRLFSIPELRELLEREIVGNPFFALADPEPPLDDDPPSGDDEPPAPP